MPSLLIMSGRQKGKTLRLPLDRDIAFGRDASCQVRLNSSEVSRLHCIVHKTVDGLTVRDAASGNGTFVNDQAIAEPTRLAIGDRLTIGTFQFEVVHEGESADATAKPEVTEENIFDWLTNDEEGAPVSGGTTIIKRGEHGTESRPPGHRDPRPSSELVARKLADVIIVQLKTNQLSAYNIRDIVGQLTQLIRRADQKKIVLDLRQVESIFSTGLTHLAEFQQRIESVGGKLRLCNLRPVVRETVEATRMSRIFDVREDEQSALESF